MYKVLLHKNAVKDLEKIKQSNLDVKAKQIIEDLKQDPYCKPVEKLVGNLKGLYSKRLNIKHRVVYSVDENEKEVFIVSMWTHYGD